MLVGDDGLHKFSLACWLMDRDIERVSSWIDPETPLDAPAFIRAKFRARRGEPAKYAQIDFNFSTRLAIPSDVWLDDFVEICGERGVMWIHQCAGAGDRPLFKGNRMSSSSAFPPIAVFVDGRVTTYLDHLSAHGSATGPRRSSPAPVTSSGWRRTGARRSAPASRAGT